VDFSIPAMVAGLVAGLLTYVDLEAVFDEPPRGLHWKSSLRLHAWWWGFVLANSLLAAVLFTALRGASADF
jgi:hypothetical protein